MRDRLRARREARLQRESARSTFKDWAAVLVDFDPAELSAASSDTTSDASAELADVCMVLVKRGASRWVMRPAQRIEALRAMGTREAIVAALDTAPALDTVEQHIYAALIRGRWDWVQFGGLEGLLSASQAQQWLAGILPDLPDEAELRRRLARAQWLEPFEKLAGGDFVGREVETRILNDFVGIPELSSPREAIASGLRGFVLKPKVGPLVLYGPGGVGKSSLVAHFVLVHDSASLAFAKFPIVYLDFDNSSLQLPLPETLCVEALRQLAVQFPAMEVVHGSAREACDARGGEDDAPEARFQSGVEFFEKWLPRFDPNLPLLLVFDTFEEAALNNRLAVSQVFHLIERLQRVCPQLRPVIVGRALDQTFGTDMSKAYDSIELGEFDLAAATSYLQRKGVDRELAQAIARQVGGTPLSLKLAAEVLAQGESADTRSGLKDLHTRSWLLLTANAAVIQGQLYQRILGHIRDLEVRKLAHPGLVLRRVTPGLIADVLAGPCGLSLPAEAVARGDAADRLFDELSRQAFLVQPAGHRAVRHRADVRRVMLELLEKDRADQVAAIHRGAVDYYERNGTTGEERAEEIYHRLKLGEDPSVVGRRWMPEAGPFLEDALEELPPRAQAAVASHAGFKLKDESVYGRASVEEWELYTERRIAEGITTRQDPERLMAMLAERSERSRKSPLYMAEARVHRYRNDFESAVRVLRLGADAMAAEGDKRLLHEHLAELGDLLIRSNRHDEAWRAYMDAAKLSIELDDRPALHSALGYCAWLAKANGRTDWEQQAQSMLAKAIEEQMPESDWTSPAMGPWLRKGIGWAGSRHPGLMVRALEHGLLDLDPGVRRVLVDVIRETPANAKLMEGIAKLFDPSAPASHSRL
jgi:hypothetical protein